MELGIKSLDRNEMTRILEKKIKTIEVHENFFNGMISLLTFLEITDPLYVPSPIGKNVCIIDKNYKWLQFAPKNQNWWLTIMYDENNNIIESYFDITKENIFKDNNPYFIDMKLDVVIPKNSEPIIIDQEELEEILTEKIITLEEYKLAIDIANNIIDNYNNNKELYYKFIEDCFNKLT